MLLSRIAVITILALTTLGCATVGAQQPRTLPELTAILAATQRHFVPDRRVARLDVTATPTVGAWLLSGETTLPAAKDSLLRALSTAGYTVQDSILLLPDAALGQATWALARHAVANLRSERGHSQELATQVLLGTPLRVLKQTEEWYLVQCPDGYIAWLHGGELVRQTEAELTNWKRGHRAIFTADSGASYGAPNADAIRVGDLVKGCLLNTGTTQGAYTQVTYPDGRQAYVLTAQLTPITEWLAAHPYNFDNTYQAATEQLGKPYLWGGTSPKAMDCSGFTKTVYWQQGLIIPRDASQQVQAGTAVAFGDDLSELVPGDLLFFGGYRADGSEKITHVGIYLGEGQFIHSGSDNGANAIQSLWPSAPDFAPHRRKALLRARRLQPSTSGVVAMATHPWFWDMK